MCINPQGYKRRQKAQKQFIFKALLSDTAKNICRVCLLQSIAQGQLVPGEKFNLKMYANFAVDTTFTTVVVVDAGSMAAQQAKHGQKHILFG